MTESRYSRINENIEDYLKNSKAAERATLITLGASTVFFATALRGVAENDFRADEALSMAGSAGLLALSGYFYIGSVESRRKAHDFELMREKHRLENPDSDRDEQPVTMYDQDQEDR